MTAAADRPIEPSSASGSGQVVLSFWVGLLLLGRGLVLLPILTKNIALPAYGSWAQITAGLGLLLPLVALGLDNGAARMWPSARERRAAATSFFSVAALVAASSALVALVGWGLARPLGELTADPDGETLVRLASLSVLLASVQRVALLWFRARRNVTMYSGLQLADAYLSVGATALLVLGGLGLVGALAGPLIVEGVIAAVGLSVVIGRIGLGRPDLGSLRPYFAFGLPLLPTGIFLWVLNAADRFILGAIDGLAPVGVYSVGYQWSYYVTLFFTPIFLILTPRTAELWDGGQASEAMRVIQRATRGGIMLTLPTIAGLTVLGPALLDLFITPEYVAGAVVIPLVGLGYMLFMVSAMNETVLNLRLQNRPLVVVYLLAAILNVVLTFVLVDAAGFVGAAAATLATFAALLAMTTALARRGPTFDLDLGLVARQAVAAAAMGGVLWRISPTGPLGLILAVPLGAAAYFAMLLLLRGIDAADIRAVRSAIVRA
ncbi:MAG: oligosaccharide flippase family protein [Elusimicrobia bacterium]|nr:oligosaccharide flippase family protein [Elusimicrobiota bacterium]